MPIAHERPVRRDPRTGKILRHQSYEGWYPTETSPRRETLVALGRGFALAALGLFVFWLVQL